MLSKNWYNEKLSGRCVVRWVQRHQINGTTKTSAAETCDDRDDGGGGIWQ